MRFHGRSMKLLGGICYTVRQGVLTRLANFSLFMFFPPVVPIHGGPYLEFLIFYVAVKFDCYKTLVNLNNENVAKGLSF